MTNDDCKLNTSGALDFVSLHRRVRKIIGQCEGIERMIDRKANCKDILLQVSAAKSALHRIGELVLQDCLYACVTNGCATRDAEGAFDRFVGLTADFRQPSIPGEDDSPLEGEKADTDSLHRLIHKTILRLKGLESQLVEGGACRSILQNAGVAKSSLRTIGEMVLHRHLRECLKEGVSRGNHEYVLNRFASAAEYSMRMRH